MLKQTLVLTTIALAMNFSAVSPVMADTIYGGGYGGYGTDTSPSKNISIDKKVKNPQTNQFVDQLSIYDPKFSSDQEVFFRITVTNSGSVTLKNITFKDVIPQYLTLTNATNMKYDKDTKTYSLVIDSLNAGEAKTYDLTGKIVTEAQLPVDNGTFCLINQAIATVDDMKAQDNAQFCIEKKVLSTTKGGLPVYKAPTLKTTPPTGAEGLLLISLAPLSGLGVLLRKKSN